MAGLLIPDLDNAILERLRSRAKAERRRVEDMARDLLASAVGTGSADHARMLAEMDRIRAMTPRRLETDSADLIRADRDSR